MKSPRDDASTTELVTDAWIDTRQMSYIFLLKTHLTYKLMILLTIFHPKFKLPYLLLIYFLIIREFILHFLQFRILHKARCRLQVLFNRFKCIIDRLWATQKHWWSLPLVHFEGRRCDDEGIFCGLSTFLISIHCTHLLFHLISKHLSLNLLLCFCNSSSFVLLFRWVILGVDDSRGGRSSTLRFDTFCFH